MASLSVLDMLQLMVFPRDCRVPPFSCDISDAAVIHADHLKLTFPYGCTTAMLAWGVLEFSDVSPMQPGLGKAAKTYG